MLSILSRLWRIVLALLVGSTVIAPVDGGDPYRSVRRPHRVEVAPPTPKPEEPIVLRSYDVPQWVMVGILYTETNSMYSTEPLASPIKYVNRRVGKAGELGPFQMTYRAFLDVRRPGETFHRIHQDPIYAEELAVRYLVMLKRRHGTWERAIRAYNGGPTMPRQTIRYLNLVLRNAQAIWG